VGEQRRPRATWWRQQGQRAHQPGHVLPPGGGRAPQGRVAHAGTADHVLHRGHGLRGRDDGAGLGPRPRLRQDGLRAVHRRQQL
ncbi:MAG: Protein translocase subunit SecE, partial [uncultured Nocardioides sp.]